MIGHRQPLTTVLLWLNTPFYISQIFLMQTHALACSVWNVKETAPKIIIILN